MPRAASRKKARTKSPPSDQTAKPPVALRCSLLGLPKELRLMIYEHLFNNEPVEIDTAITYPRQKRQDGLRLHPLAQAYPALLSEILKVWGSYQPISYYITDKRALTAAKKSLSKIEPQLQYLRKLTLRGVFDRLMIWLSFDLSTLNIIDARMRASNLSAPAVCMTVYQHWHLDRCCLSRFLDVFSRLAQDNSLGQEQKSKHALQAILEIISKSWTMGVSETELERGVSAPRRIFGCVSRKCVCRVLVTPTACTVPQSHGLRDYDGVAQPNAFYDENNIPPAHIDGLRM